jgi:SAM-dependent methyltransferase
VGDPPLVDVGAFDRVEGTGAAADFVTWMAHQRRGGADAAVAALGLHPGDRVLDLGCGPGIDLAALTTHVTPPPTAPTAADPLSPAGPAGRTTLASPARPDPTESTPAAPADPARQAGPTEPFPTESAPAASALQVSPPGPDTTEPDLAPPVGTVRPGSPAVGLAVGIDRSAAMAGAARATAPGAAVVVGDGQALPFPSSAFAGAWARAVLVHTPSPAAAVAELARVVRPGGHLVLSEPDHGSHLVATDEIDVFERVRAHRRTTFRHPLVGRDLPALAVGAGLEVVGRWLGPIEHRTLAAARASGGPFDVAVAAAVEAGAVTAAEGQRYLASLEERDAAGAFLFAALSVTVVARCR